MLLHCESSCCDVWCSSAFSRFMCFSLVSRVTNFLYIFFVTRFFNPNEMREENAVMQRWCGRQSHSSRKPRLHLHTLQHAKELRFSWLCAAFITSDVVDRYFCGFLAFPHFLILYSLRLLLYFLRSLTPSSHYDSFLRSKGDPTDRVCESIPYFRALCESQHFISFNED